MNSVQSQTRMGDATEDEAVRALFFMHSSPRMPAQTSLEEQQERIPNLTISIPAQPKSIPMNGFGSDGVSRSLRQNGYNDMSLSSNPHAAAGTLCALMSTKQDRKAYTNGFDQREAVSVEHSRARALSLMSLDTEYDTHMNENGLSTTLSSSLPDTSFLDLYRSGVNGSNLNNGQRMIGTYTLANRRKLLDRFLEKRKNRTWKKKIKYDVRKNFADSRLRVKGRFVRKEDEEQLREVLLMTA